MNWYVQLYYANGMTENMYCTSRSEARERRRFYLTMTEHGHPTSVIRATVRPV